MSLVPGPKVWNNILQRIGLLDLREPIAQSTQTNKVIQICSFFLCTWGENEVKNIYLLLIVLYLYHYNYYLSQNHIKNKTENVLFSDDIDCVTFNSFRLIASHITITAKYHMSTSWTGTSQNNTWPNQIWSSCLLEKDERENNAKYLEQEIWN